MARVGSLLCPIIVGRDDILGLVDSLIDETARGRGRAVFLSGQAGLGKTRLIRAAVRKAEAAGLRVDGGSVAPQDQQVPLASIREMAVGMRGNEAFGSLSQDLLAIDGRHDGDALGARRLIVRSAADLILGAIDRPTMLIFDDLHWTDELSLEVIGELARHVEDRPLLLLGGYRADEFPTDTLHREWRARLLSQRHAEEVRLRPLTLDETAVATTLILGRELPTPRDVVAAVHERTNGIPLHIEELLAALDDEARTDGRRIRDAHVPDTIGDAVLARLSRLSDDARLVARAGAVVGRCFSPDVLAGILDRPLPELEPALEELVDAAILRPFDYIDQGYYDFRHQLLRDAVYGSVPPSQLRRFHAQAAEFVMSLEAASIVHASRHFERAGLKPQAFRAAMSGASEANRISARQEAYDLYRRAIDNMPPDTPIGEQAKIYRSYAGTAAAIERIGDGRAAAYEARRLFTEAGRPAEAAEMLVDIANLDRRSGGSLESRRKLITQGLAELDGASMGPEVDTARTSLLSFQSLNEFDSADFAEAWRLNQAYLTLATAMGDPELILDAQFFEAMIALARGEDDASLERLVAIAREARVAGYEDVGVTSFRVAATMAARVMDYRAAEGAILEGLEYADAIEQSHCRQQMAATSALIAWARGEWDAASHTARQELVERGCRRGALGAVLVIGFVALGRGEVDDARRWLEEALAQGRTIDDVEMLLPPLWGLAELDLIAGNPTSAVERSAEALEIAERTGERPFFVPFVVTGVRALLAAHRPDDGERWLTAVRAHLAGWEMAEAALANAEGLVRLAHGSVTAAREAFETAIHGWTDRGRVWEASWARLDLAQALIRSNRFGEAAAVLAELRATATDLGSSPLASRVDELERTARGRGTIDEPWRPLSAREFEVARLIAAGMTNGEIADQLTIAPKTASAHVEHILAKLGVTRRAEIAAWVANIARPGSLQPAEPAPSRQGVAAAH
jgi:DNA-binding CsgD family transcriptional regulator/tetratricopeptide (TPR) repeat protein